MCESFSALTKAEADAEHAELMVMLNRALSGKSPCCDAALDTSQCALDGTGPQFCSKCKAFVMRACRPNDGEPI